MKAAIIAIMILLLPAVLLAAPTMGIYFTYTPTQMYYSPVPFEMFNAYIYVHGTNCFLNAAEFEICYPTGIVQIGWTIPPGSVELGNPDTGYAVTFWPPMDGWNPGYNGLITLQLLATSACVGEGGTLVDAPIEVFPNHETGLIQGSCWPENYLIEFTGLTSTICPSCISVQESNWGAIKSLF